MHQEGAVFRGAKFVVQIKGNAKKTKKAERY
jgi:hypothetical protein